MQNFCNNFQSFCIKIQNNCWLHVVEKIKTKCQKKIDSKFKKSIYYHKNVTFWTIFSANRL